MDVTGSEFVAAGERLRALLWPLDQYANQALELVREHPFVIPEISEANKHVAAALDAVQRASEVLDVKCQVEIERLRAAVEAERLGPDGPPLLGPSPGPHDPSWTSGASIRGRTRHFIGRLFPGWP